MEKYNCIGKTIKSIEEPAFSDKYGDRGIRIYFTNGSVLEVFPQNDPYHMTFLDILEDGECKN